MEPYFIQKAKHDHKPMSGLVPLNEHIAVFGKMNDADSEATLLLAFIHLNTGGKTFDQMVGNWKHGNMDGVEKMEEEEYRGRAFDPHADAHRPQRTVDAQARGLSALGQDVHGHRRRGAHGGRSRAARATHRGGLPRRTALEPRRPGRGRDPATFRKTGPSTMK